MSTVSTAAESRPVIVLVDPTWNFELENFDVERFFEEAKVTEDSVGVLRGRFERFCSTGRGGCGGGERVSQVEHAGRIVSLSGECDAPHVTLEDFRRLNEHYSVCRPSEEERYFVSMDKKGRGRLYFQDFLMGCAAANPSTPHILNSFTGYVRARYIFAFYNVSRSGTLDYQELAQLVADSRRHLDEAQDDQQKYVLEIAQDLGAVSAVTIRVSGGPRGLALCDLRVSTHWTGHRLQCEIARELQVPVEGQELYVGDVLVHRSQVLDAVVPIGAASMDVRLVHHDWDGAAGVPPPPAQDAPPPGLERLAHVTFQRLYAALVSEQLRGTSRLFRFHRSILHTKANKVEGALGGA